LKKKKKLLTIEQEYVIIPIQQERRNDMDNVTRHKALTEEIHALYERKNHDYGDSFSRTYKTLGIISAVTRITDKYNRLVALATTKEKAQVNESLRDTLIDMANYCLMTVMELEGENDAE